MSGMSLNQARVVLAGHRDNLEAIKGQIALIEQATRDYIHAVQMRVNEIEAKMRENSRGLVVLQGSGISNEDIVSMRGMYAAALENTDRARLIAQHTLPVNESLRNARANLALILGAIQRNV